ncbi:putative pectin methylesterase [Pseudomassariella vexata]|uniref:Pectinesterase n=1 Tax=Pseudomassariella vexata TaxID=1141098 RepID=A0A1Y2EAG4_9PEZI|nr:putative pectin methylesterase [Pseudomassariella vexata]ORY68578.1 putative pectin methylesterase [Pseudomassariella vexata]
MKYLSFSVLVTTVLAISRTTPPSGSITVCSSGCDYATIQKAISSISTSSTSAHNIFIYSGTYTEQVTVPALDGSLSIYGYTTDTSSYAENVVNLQFDLSIASGATDDEHTAALINLSENVAVYNINIKNTYGEGSQAIALSAYNTKQGYYGVGLYGYQDTLLAETGNQIYARCYIQGATDFIFGQHARAWITGSTIAATAAGDITANGRSSSTDVSYYVINDSTIGATSGATLTAGTVYLGRPWSEYARVCFQDCSLSSIINSAGWSVWSSSDPNTDDVTFQEYGNTGTGASGTRASFSTKLSAPITIDTILGSDYEDWVDTSYL